MKREWAERNTLSNRPPLFALIIGINNYDNLRKLHGAVPDAKAVQEYLMDHLKVPEEQIRTLLDLKATREAIITTFQELRRDERIQENDPILIYYAGHGGKIDAPRGWNSSGPNGKIEAIYSQDYAEQKVEPIPDRTIAALLDRLAEEKGDNIVRLSLVLLEVI